MKEYEILIRRAIQIKQEKVQQKENNGFYYALENCPVWFDAALFCNKGGRTGKAFIIHLALSFFLEHPEKINHFSGVTDDEARKLFENLAYGVYSEEVSVLEYRFPELENDIEEIRKLLPKLIKLFELLREKEKIQKEISSD